MRLKYLEKPSGFPPSWRSWTMIWGDGMALECKFKCFADHPSREIGTSFHINLRYSSKICHEGKCSSRQRKLGQKRKGNRYYKKNHIKKACNGHKAWNKNTKAQSSDVGISDAVVQWIRRWFLGISSVNIEFNFRLMFTCHLATSEVL